MKNELDQILTEEILEGCLENPELCLEADGKPVKVYGKVAGLNCIGRSYFWEYGELEKTYQWAQAQMTNKYGAEMYGSSAQLSRQSANKSSTGNDSGTGTGVSGGPTNSSLISCSVSPLMQLPDKFVTEADGKAQFQDFWKSFTKFCQQLDGIRKNDKDGKFPLAKDVDQIFSAGKKFKEGSGPQSKDNTDPFNEIMKIVEKPEWKKFLDSQKAIKQNWENAVKGFKAWSGGELPSNDGSGKDGGGTEKLSSGKNKTNEWNPRQAYRIDIHTSFDDSWYKRKFKSGLLNKVIFAIKTDMRSHGTEDMNKSDPMANHKYTADEMLPQDVQKLDSLQWKMTNKVAKDFINLFMGWSRKKERYPDEDGKIGQPVQTQLERDESFGKKMASAALDNRGILGRLKQKIFSGGQSNNVISVAFQLADPYDGWKIVKENDKGDGVPEEKEGEDGKDGAGEGGQEGGGQGGGSGNGGSNGSGNGNGSGGRNGGEGGENGSGPGGKIDDKQMQELLTLLQRVRNVEKQVYGKQMDESISESGKAALDRFIMDSIC